MWGGWLDNDDRGDEGGGDVLDNGFPVVGSTVVHILVWGAYFLPFRGCAKLIYINGQNPYIVKHDNMLYIKMQIQY